MKKIIPLDTKILAEYSEWEAINNKWNIASYLNQYYDINTAIAFSKLYFPDFIEKDGCVILSFRYDEGVFNEWYSTFKGNISEVEMKCNLYEVKDYFHINRPEDLTEDNYNLAIDTLASILKISWEINLKLLFPNKKYKVDVFDDYESTRITFYSEI